MADQAKAEKLIATSVFRERRNETPQQDEAPYMDAYTHNPHDVQQKGCAVEILTEDQIVSSPAEEFRQFRGRYLNRHAATQLKWAIVTLWQKDEMDPVEAVTWLYECGFVKFHEADGKDADAFMQFYTVRERNRAEGRAA